MSGARRTRPLCALDHAGGHAEAVDTCSFSQPRRRNSRLPDGKESTTLSGYRRARRWKAARPAAFKLPFPTTRNLIKLGSRQSSGPRSMTAGQIPRHGTPIMTRNNGGAQLRIPLEPATTATCSSRVGWLAHFDIQRSIFWSLQHVGSLDSTKRRTTDMKPYKTGQHGRRIALLLVLATLWGASYTFIRVAVATVPPITLIAGRTAIAGLLLLIIMRWRGVRMPRDAANCDASCFRPASTA